MRAERIELVARRALDNRAEALKALDWYHDAREYAQGLAKDYRLSRATVVGVVAALSPQSGWTDQLAWTPRVLASFWTVDERASIEEIATALPGPGFLANKRKAARILKGADPLSVLSGPKVRAFFSSIMGATDDVCVDRHAFAIAWGPDAPPTLTAKRYRDTVTAYRIASARLRSAFPSMGWMLTPTGVQALTWVWWRDNPTDRF